MMNVTSFWWRYPLTKTYWLSLLLNSEITSRWLYLGRWKPRSFSLSQSWCICRLAVFTGADRWSSSFSSGSRDQRISLSRPWVPSSLGPLLKLLHSCSPLSKNTRSLAWASFEIVALFPKNPYDMCVRFPFCKCLCQVIMVKVDSPVTLINLHFLICRMQYQLFSFKFLEAYDHQPGLHLTRQFWPEGSMALLQSKFNICKGLQLFFNWNHQ